MPLKGFNQGKGTKDMRITRDTLLKLARNTTAERVYQNRQLICVYLTGSLLMDEPLLGGTTDIDLIFVHSASPEQSREIVRVTHQIHLDIAHYDQAVFQQPRHLRLDPWIGSFLCKDPICLHDSGHWFEFTQAGVYAQFMRPENIIQRARPFAAEARQIWFELLENPSNAGPQPVCRYLKALERAANSIAMLSGTPLTERRFLLQFPERVAALERPGLSAGLVDLFTADPLTEETWQMWLEQWGTSLKAAARLDNVPARLSAPRFSYYQSAIETLHSDHPEAALWILLRTWVSSILYAGDNPAFLESWQQAARTLHLDESHFPERIKALDAYLDTVEETLDLWAQKNGVSA